MRSRLALLAALSLFVLCGADDPRQGLDIYFIDVDGGASTLLVTPERESVLIDSGWPGRDDRDPKRIVHVLKDVAGCDHLDHHVTTHWHMDHFGGVEGLSKLVRIDQFWDRGLPEDEIAGLDFPDGPTPDDPLGIAYRKASAGKRHVLRAGDRLPLRGHVFDGVRAVVLAASGKVLEDARETHPASCVADPKNPLCDDAPPDRPADSSDNARSLVIRFEFGPFTFLDCGDLTWNIEKQLVCPYNRVGDVDLFQVTHHGLDISNHPTLLRTIKPVVAVMNNGSRKGGSAATVKRLRALPGLRALYQLHKNAATGPEDNTEAALIANPDPAGGQFIHVSVSPDGERFTVQFGTDGPSRTFETHQQPAA